MSAVEIGPLDGVGILGAGTAFPERSFSNLDVLRNLPAHLHRRGPPSDEELQFVSEGVEQSLGLKSRAWAHVPGTPLAHGHEESTLDLSLRAAKAALADAGLTASDVSLVLCATSTPHRMTSTISAAVGTGLGARAACMDTRTGCSAGLFALSTAGLYAHAGALGDGVALVIGAETFSKVLPAESRLAQLSLGDGAGAIVVGKKASASLRAAYLETDGSLGRLITTDGALPPTEDELRRGGYLLSGAPDELLQVVPGKYLAAITHALTRAQVRPDELDLYVPHQTSATLIAEVARQVGIPHERAFVNVGAHANIGSAGWIVALAEARAAGRVRDGMTLGLAAVGGGMSWAAAVLRW
ncbi:MAG: 3-oxoacyl-ACP synthase III family protein [Deltaproteobacteria bacterium]|nr:3-oxoacyl-ACP synthase III family protein [Deltaproteobacteria bacterium]